MLQTWSAVILICLSVSAADSSDHITQVLLQKCSGSNRFAHLGTCFKLDVLRLMSLLGNTTRLPLAPGVALVGTDRTRNVAEELDRNLVSSPRSLGQLDHLIWTAAEKYLGSLNLTVQLRDSRLLQGARGLMTDVVEGYPPEIHVHGEEPAHATRPHYIHGVNSWYGRGVKKPMWILIGTIGAVAFALLATITGQALMASILALIMSGVMMFRGALGGNFGSPSSAMANGRITAYEIVRPGDFAVEPAPVVHDHNHHHAALTALVPIGRDGVTMESYGVPESVDPNLIHNHMRFETRERSFRKRKMLST